MSEGAPRRPFREATEACVSAFTVALLLKVFVVEAYRIPSGSMQPTLFGHVAGDGRSVKDTVLVDRFAYVAGDPARYDVAVFRFPLDRGRAFVKRVWGLPGDTLRIANGDVQRLGPDGAWRALQRPEPVMREMWLPLEHHGGWGLAGARVDASPGDVDAARVETDPAGGALVFPKGADLGGEAAPSIVDLYRDGYPAALRERLPEGGGAHPVGDLRLAFELTVPADDDSLTEVTVELHERSERGWQVTRAVLPVAGRGAPDARAALTVIRPGEAAPRGAAALGGPAGTGLLRPGERARVTVSALDDVARLALDAPGGGVAQSAELDPVEPRGAFVRIALDGRATLTGLSLARDVHYVLGRAATDTWTVPDGAYFVLGDNTQRSVDSREWRAVEYVFEDGPRFGEVVRGQAIPGENPLAATSEGPEPVWYFRDEWGERQRLPVGEVGLPPPEEAPFVPRDHFVGRAFLVVWPPLPGSPLARPRVVR